MPDNQYELRYLPLFYTDLEESDLCWELHGLLRGDP